MVAVKRIPKKTNRGNHASTSKTIKRSSSSEMDSLRFFAPEPIPHFRSVNKAEAMDPADSPFFLPSADHPGLLLVSLKLDGENFDDWNADMKIALDAKNKLGFVDGSLLRLIEDDPHFRIWSRCNNMVKSRILNAVSPQISRSILRMIDACDKWKDLYNRFHMSNLPRTFNPTQEIQDLRQGTMSLSEYYTKLKILWDHLEGSDEPDEACTCGKASNWAKKTERGRIVKFLAGLNDSYNIIRRQIIMKKSLPSISEVYNLLDQDMSQPNFTTAIQPTAFQFAENQTTDQNQATTCYVHNTFNKSRPTCSFCNKLGHVAERCYRKHGFPPGHNSKMKPYGDRHQNAKPYAEKFQRSFDADKFSRTKPVAAKVHMPSSSETKATNLDNMVGDLTKDLI